MTALHATIGELCAKLDSVSQYTEKPEVQELAKQLCDSIRTEMAAIEGAFSGIYRSPRRYSPRWSHCLLARRR